MGRSTQGKLAEKELEEDYLEIIEGIHLVGVEAPSFPIDFLLHTALEEEIRRIQQRAESGDKMARHYVGGMKQALSPNASIFFQKLTSLPCDFSAQPL